MAQDLTYRAELNYQNEITADEITVIFNGTTYTVPKDLDGDYGLTALTSSGSSTGDYPFCITRESGTNYVYVNADVYANHNPFTIKIVGDFVTTTECFKKAVQSAASPLVVAATLSPGEATSQSPSYLNASIKEITEAMITRGVVVRDPYGILYSVLSVTDATVTIAIGVYNSTTQQTDFSAFCYVVEGSGLQYPRTGLQ
jgi:hypothetical protein